MNNLLTKTSKSKLLGIVFGLILLFLVIIVSIFLLNKNRSEINDGKAVVDDQVSLLVFSSRVDNSNNGKDVYTIKSDGTDMKKLTHTNDRGEEGAVISKDGKKIAFKSNRDDPTGKGNYEIYVMNVDGTNVKRLTNNPAHDRGASWSPNGDRISFSSDRSGNHDIYIMNSADGSNVRQVTEARTYESISNWHPFEEKIAYSCERGSDKDICVMDLTTNVERNLTSDSPGDDAIASWSPNGTKIAYRKGAGSIWVMNADGSNKKQLTNNGMGPTWSPDGTKLAFSSSRTGDDGSEIYIMNADGSNQHKLINLPDSLEDDIDWGIYYQEGDDDEEPSQTLTPTPTPTPTDKPVNTPTPTDTPVNTPTISDTPIITDSPVTTPTMTNTPVPQITDSPTPVNTQSPTPSYVEGNICGKSDVDGDDRFKIQDFTEFARAYGNGKKTCADKNIDYGPCGGRDVNRDGFLNITDFGAIGIGFAQRYYPKTSCVLP